MSVHPRPYTRFHLVKRCKVTRLGVPWGPGWSIPTGMTKCGCQGWVELAGGTRIQFAITRKGEWFWLPPDTNRVHLCQEADIPSTLRKRMEVGKTSRTKLGHLVRKDVRISPFLAELARHAVNEEEYEALHDALEEAGLQTFNLERGADYCHAVAGAVARYDYPF